LIGPDVDSRNGTYLNGEKISAERCCHPQHAARQRYSRRV